MTYDGLIIGAVFLAGCGLGHIIIVKGQYHFGTGWWPLLLALGIALLVLSLFVSSALLSAALGVMGFTSLWSIYELFKQRERVARGWFPSKRGGKQA